MVSRACKVKSWPQPLPILAVSSAYLSTQARSIRWWLSVSSNTVATKPLRTSEVLSTRSVGDLLTTPARYRTWSKWRQTLRTNSTGSEADPRLKLPRALSIALSSLGTSATIKCTRPLIKGITMTNTTPNTVISAQMSNVNCGTSSRRHSLTSWLRIWDGLI